jgi:hypothetical protein
MPDSFDSSKKESEESETLEEATCTLHGQKASEGKGRKGNLARSSGA